MPAVHAAPEYPRVVEVAIAETSFLITTANRLLDNVMSPTATTVWELSGHQDVTESVICPPVSSSLDAWWL